VLRFAANRRPPPEVHRHSTPSFVISRSRVRVTSPAPVFHRKFAFPSGVACSDHADPQPDSQLFVRGCPPEQSPYAAPPWPTFLAAGARRGTGFSRWCSWPSTTNKVSPVPGSGLGGRGPASSVPVAHGRRCTPGRRDGRHQAGRGVTANCAGRVTMHVSPGNEPPDRVTLKTHRTSSTASPPRSAGARRQACRP
jgi:hypothetical protein